MLGTQESEDCSWLRDRSYSTLRRCTAFPKQKEARNQERTEVLLTPVREGDHRNDRWRWAVRIIKSSVSLFLCVSDSALELQMKGIQIVCKPIWTTCLLERRRCTPGRNERAFASRCPRESRWHSEPRAPCADWRPLHLWEARGFLTRTAGIRLLALRAALAAGWPWSAPGLLHTPFSPPSFCPLGFPDGVSGTPLCVFGGPLPPASLPRALHLITELTLV